MYTGKKGNISVLIVSASQKAEEYLKDVAKSSGYSPISTAKSIAEAGRMQVDESFDVVIINTPLPDDFGLEFAEQLSSDSAAGVLLLVKNELFEQVSCRMEKSGVITLARPGTRQSITQAVHIAAAMHIRLAAFQKRAITLETKMKEIRIINRAKWLLIDRYNMSEDEAHKYIEKSAMDACVKRAEIAENIIKTYGDSVK